MPEYARTNRVVPSQSYAAKPSLTPVNRVTAHSALSRLLSSPFILHNPLPSPIPIVCACSLSLFLKTPRVSPPPTSPVRLISPAASSAPPSGGALSSSSGASWASGFSIWTYGYRTPKSFGGRIQLTILALWPSPTTTRLFVDVTGVIVELGLAHFPSTGSMGDARARSTVSGRFCGWLGCGLAQNCAVSIGAVLVNGVGLRGIQEVRAKRGVLVLVCGPPSIPSDPARLEGAEESPRTSPCAGIGRIGTRTGERQHDNDVLTLFPAILQSSDLPSAVMAAVGRPALITCAPWECGGLRLWPTRLRLKPDIITCPPSGAWNAVDADSVARTLDMPPYAPTFHSDENGNNKNAGLQTPIEIDDFNDDKNLATLRAIFRRINELEAQGTKGKKKTRSHLHLQKSFTNVGWCIHNVATFGPIDSLIAEHDRRQELEVERNSGDDVHDEEEEPTMAQNRAYNGYTELIRFIPALRKALLEFEHDELTGVISSLRNGARNARSTKNLKAAIVPWLQTLFPEMDPLDPDSRDD
ncbi:hypothetical protein B0H13DRAFT_2568447 [Mycena leptocephala]|nr:hypothetical protein B0H13DRAFT_2568447 [Mycena leptocephala]